MRMICSMVLACCLAGAGTAAAETVQVKAESNFDLVMIEASRTADYTLIGLQAQAAVKLCWNATGEDSPYLLADGRRYRYLGGANASDCPAHRDYAKGEIMVLSFAPLGPEVHEFSLIEGRGGENQLAGGASSKGETYINFLHVKLK